MPAPPSQRDLFGRRANPPLPRRAPAPPAPSRLWARALRRRGWALVLAWGLSGAAAWAACRWMQPVFAATASVEVRSPAPPLRFADEPAPAPELDSSALATQAGELGSQAAVSAALARLAPAQAAALPAGRWRRRKIVAAATPALIAQAALRQLAIEPEAQSRLIHLRFEAPSPALAGDFLHALIAADLAGAQARSQADGRARAAYLAAQAEAARTRVEAAQAVLQQWTAVHGFADPAAQMAVATQRWQQLAQAQTAAEVAGLEQADTLAANAVPASSPANASGLPDAPTDLEVKRAEAQAEVRRLAALYRPEAAPLRQAQQALDSLDASLDGLRAQYRSQRQRSLASAQQQARDLADAVAKQVRGQAGLRQAAGDFDLAQRNLQADQTVYSGLLDQLQQAVAEAEQVALPLRVADPVATQPQPVRPNLLQALAYAWVMGALLGVAAVWGLEAFDDGLRLPEAAELPAPLVGLLPPARRAQPAWSPGAALDPPNPTFARGLEGMAAALLLAQAEAGARVIYITSVHTGEGKTGVALHLARRLAQAAPGVLLIEGNPHRPALHAAAGAEAAPGLTALLEGSASIEQALRRWPGAEELYYLPGGVPVAASRLAVSLAAGAGAALLAAARARYAWVVVDGGPMPAGPETGIWANLADCCLLVARHRRTSRRCALHALELMAASGAAAQAIVLNHAPAAHRTVLPTVWLAAPGAQPAPAVAELRQWA